MKKIVLFVALLSFFHLASAKYVKFAVDMAGQTINATGVHVFGDFQTAAGFAGGDWNPATTQLNQEGTSTIYSIVVNIPANHVYRYQYLNGNLSYEVEFVPIPSRVLYNNLDSRWLFIDSLTNDTTYIGAMRFSGNAPFGKRAMRIRACLGGMQIDSAGVHIATSEQPWDTKANQMWSFDGQLYEYINLIDSAVALHEYRFVNGNTAAKYEVLPSACSVFGNRESTISNDTILPAFYFATCDTCMAAPAAVKQLREDEEKTVVTPNPANQEVVIKISNQFQNGQLRITDITGKIYMDEKIEGTTERRLDVSLLPIGLYFLTIHSHTASNSCKISIIR